MNKTNKTKAIAIAIEINRPRNTQMKGTEVEEMR
jgi:hypothetical protein